MSLSLGVGVLTYNHVFTGRQEDFERTWASLKRESPDQLVVLTNGSTDGTQDRVEELGGIVDNADSRIWYGNTRLIEELRHNDLIMLSADDLEYESGWCEAVKNFMAEAPEDIALLSLSLEPLYPWNTPSEAVTYGGQTALVRESVCGSSWVFRSADWFEWMGPFPQIMPGEDLEVCKRIQAKGRKMAALDLSEHIGEDRSAWGNTSHLSARPLDKAAWGL